MGWDGEKARFFDQDGNVDLDKEAFDRIGGAYRFGGSDGVYYAAIKNSDDDIWCLVLLLEVRYEDGEAWVYEKEIEECMGPAADECPENVLSALTPVDDETANEWRYSCWKNILRGLYYEKSITIPGFVTEIGDCAFSDFENLESITIPNSVTEIGSLAFDGCTSLKSITIPNLVTCIGKRAFDGCTSLKSITIPNSVTYIGEGAFCGCNLYEISVDKNNKVYDSRNDCNAIIETATNTLITGCNNTVIPDSVTEIGHLAFDGCTSLKSITIPNSVTYIGEGAFRGCTSLKSITIPNSVIIIGHLAFDGCTSLKSITIPNSVTCIRDGAFFGCESLTIEYLGTKEQWEALDCDAECEVVFHSK